MQQPILFNQIAGNAKLPYINTIGYEVAPKSTLQFDYENLDAGASYSKLGLVLHGYKIYRAGR